MKILITGASGFIGSFIVEEALRRGFETWAAIRKGSSKRYLQDPRIHFITLNLGNEQQLVEQLKEHAFNYVVHAAGATKCLRADDFYKINTEGTQHLVNALLATGQPLRRLIYLSSLSIFGPIHEEMPHREITEEDTPQPNTHYGKSKWAAEKWLDSMADKLDCVTLRPTGVYGPREKDYFLMVKSMKQHLDFAAGFEPQDITFVYVRDVVEAVFLALERGKAGRKYFISDGEVYRSSTFADLIRRELGQPWRLRFTAPLWLLRIITTLGEQWSHITGSMTALNNDKYNILSQRNWKCDITPARRELGFDPRWKLADGVRETVAWYKKERWI